MTTSIKILNELRKVKEYKWGRKQGNIWDNRTRFIYKILTYSDLMEECQKRFPEEQDLINYAICRFYNFHAHNLIQDIFINHPQVRSEQKKKHKTIDFYINDEPFDLKLSVYPKSLIGKVKSDKEICQWMYRNQSGQQRYHRKNRLFIIVLDDDNHADSWKVKREYNLIKKEVDFFMNDQIFVEVNNIKAGVISVIQYNEE